MADSEQVKKYLAYWFQLGKRVMIRGGAEALRPQTIIQGDRYSNELEACWSRVLAPESGDCYLEGTEETIADLLSDAWEISDCSRCAMPVPIRNLGITSLACPCNDLPGWPDTETPAPRSPISSTDYLTQLRERLGGI
jgi:hypothetical protein